MIIKIKIFLLNNYEKIHYWLRNFTRGVKNIVRWIPILYKDRDWDHSYILDILKFKLQNVANSLEKHDKFIGVEYEVQRIKTCIKLIDIIKDEKYSDDFHNNLDLKWGKTNFIFYTLLNKPGYKGFKLKHANVNTEEDEIQYNKEFNEGMKLVRAKHEKVKNLLFKILAKHIEYWWE